MNEEQRSWKEGTQLKSHHPAPMKVTQTRREGRVAVRV